MSEFEEMLAKLQEQKPELTRPQIEEMIRQKKDKIGAGYLTDQGALFLIASDLGITLAEPPKVEMGLKDIYIGAKEISLETRVLSLSPPKQLSRKDGTPFLLRTMTVYDNDSTASVKLWDEKANLPGIDDLKPGDLIKIIKAYVRSDLGGLPTINVGSGSTIEPVDSDSEIASIDSITVDAGSLEQDQKDLAVSGLIEEPINTIRFTDKRGQPGKGLSFRLKGADGGYTRTVIWGKDESDLPAVIAPGSKARLLGVKTKKDGDGLQIYGNESTLIEVDGSQEIKPMMARIISVAKSDSGNCLILGVDEGKNLLRFSDTAGVAAEFAEGDVIECVPSRMYGKSVTLDGNSFVRKMDDLGTIPKRDDLRTKIADVAAGKSYCIEAIILKIPDRREVQTKTGESVALGEMFVEDDTGQIWIKGWRGQARMIDGCALGEIISVTDLNARAGLEGRIELFLGPFSRITKRN